MTVRTALASVLVVSLGAGASGLAAPGLVAAVTAPTKLTLMGWNIRGLGQNQTWEVARESIIAYMLDSGADIIALQEARRAVADMMADPVLGSRYDFYQTASDNPILIDRSLPSRCQTTGQAASDSAAKALWPRFRCRPRRPPFASTTVTSASAHTTPRTEATS